VHAHYQYPRAYLQEFFDKWNMEVGLVGRDHWIENNPGMNILYAHKGIAERLDIYPNMQVEPAARFGDLARQDNEKVSACFEKYQDRIMFGSDIGNSGPEDELTEAELREERADLDAS
jgi:hypothetical protein